MILLVALAGCADERLPSTASNTPSNTPAVAKSRPSVALRVLVVNEPELAEAIERLRGEWAERFGGSLSAVAKPWPEVAAADSLDADAIIFPSRYLGELCARDWLRPVRANVLESRSLDWDDIYPMVRRKLVTWGREVIALPLGVDVPRANEAFDRRPAIALLVAAAPNVVLATREGVLFDPQTMNPRIAKPPFVEALTQLADAKAVDDPTPSALIDGVPVLGVGDRVASVTTSSRNAATAFKLLGWLATAEISSQLARAGDGTRPVRRSLASSPAWYDPTLSAAERNELGKVLDQSLGGQRCLVVPRIPGIDQYLAALDAAIQDALLGNTNPQTALKQVAAEWEKITDALGRETQLQAYRKHLGLSLP